MFKYPNIFMWIFGDYFVWFEYFSADNNLAANLAVSAS